MAADKSPSDEKTENPKVHNLPKDCYLIRFFQTKKHIKRNRKKNRETSVSRKGPRSGLRPFIKVRRRKGSSANKTPQPNKKRPSNNNTITPRTREYIIQFFMAYQVHDSAGAVITKACVVTDSCCRGLKYLSRYT